jgi:hypothetical protein
MKSSFHAFCKLMRDSFHYIGDNQKLGMTPLKAMQYLLDPRIPTAEFIPICLRYFRFIVKRTMSYWFGRYFTTLEALFLGPEQQQMNQFEKNEIVVFLRNDIEETSPHGSVEYIRLKINLGLGFEHFFSLRIE